MDSIFEYKATSIRPPLQDDLDRVFNTLIERHMPSISDIKAKICHLEQEIEDECSSRIELYKGHVNEIQKVASSGSHLHSPSINYN